MICIKAMAMLSFLRPDGHHFDFDFDYKNKQNGREKNNDQKKHRPKSRCRFRKCHCGLIGMSSTSSK